MTPRAKEYDRLGATPREMLEVAATKPLEFKPGTKLDYSNTGYILLGMAIEKVSGQTYADFLKKNIFGPLGMEHSGYDDQSQILKNRASGYSARDGQAINAEFSDMTVPFAAGGIYSTVRDIFSWNEALTVPGRLLTARSLEQMFAVYLETTAYGEQNYGYGVVIAHRSEDSCTTMAADGMGLGAYCNDTRRSVCVLWCWKTPIIPIRWTSAITLLRLYSVNQLPPPGEARQEASQAAREVA